MSNYNNIKYFIFSATAYKLKQDLFNKLGKIYKPGEVLVNGIYKQFTEIVNEPNESRFSDAIIVASGDIREIKYKK